MNCPKCRSLILAEDVNLDNLVAKCRYCDDVFSFADQVQRSLRSAIPKLPVGKPENVHIEEFGEQRRIVQRWFASQALFYVFFCISWDSFLVFWYWMAFQKPGPEAWLMMIFPIVHVAVGIGLTYFTLATLVNRTVVTIDGNDLRIRHEPLPWRGNRTLDAAQIVQLYCDQITQNGNRRPAPCSYNVNALLADERRLKLLSGLDKDLAFFYEQKLEEWLGIEPYPVKGEAE